MVDKSVLEPIAKANNSIVLKVLNEKKIQRKEIQELILDILWACEPDEIEDILENVNKKTGEWKM